MDEKARGIGDPDRTSGRADEDIQAYVRESERERRPGENEYASPPSSDIADDTDRRTREIRADIEQTRENMSETIEAIQERLRPRNIVANATESVKSATSEKVKRMANTASETASQVAEQTRGAAEYVVEEAKQNPIPAALIGIGAAWLWMSRSGHTTGERPRYVNTRGEISGGGGFMDRIKENPIPAVLAGVGLAWLAFAGNRRRNGSDWLSDDYYRARREGYGYETYRSYGGGEHTGDTGAEASGLTNRMTESAREYAEGVREYVRDAGDTAREYARDAGERVRYTTRRAQNRFQRLMRENPLLVGAAALVVGAAVGAALPETDVENDWMGDARDTVVERAQDMARDAANKVQDAASKVADTAASAKETIGKKNS